MTHTVSRLLIGLLLVATATAADDAKCKQRVRECDLQIRQLLGGRRYFGATIEDRKPGLVVSKIVQSGPAARGGLRLGDRFVAINAKSLTMASSREFKQILADARETGRLSIIVWRVGHYVRLDARLEPYNEEQLEKMIAAHVAQSHVSSAGAH